MITRHTFISSLLALLALGAFSGCTTERLDPITTDTIAGKKQFVHDRFGVCWPFDFDRSVPADPVPPGNTGEFIAGFNNHIRHGESCNTQESFAYRGAVAFNLAGVHDVVVTRAALRLDRRNTPVPIRVPGGNLCMLDVKIATGDWRHGEPGDNFASRGIPTRFPLAIQQDGSTIGIGTDVTWAVQQWALGRIPNFGFVITPRDGDIAKNENTCTGYWSNPRLEITVARRAEGS